MLCPLVKKLVTMLVYIVYHPDTLGLVSNVLSHIGVDSDIPTKLSSTGNTESLVLVYLAIIIVEALFLSQIN